MSKLNDLHRSIFRAFAMDIDSAAIMADAASSVLRIAEERDIPPRIALTNACAQMLLAIAGSVSDMHAVQKAADLLSEVLEARLAYDKLQPSRRAFTASADAKERAS